MRIRKPIPVHKRGVKKNIRHSVIASSLEEAAAIFLRAKERLMDVNHWKDFAGKSLATFNLTDSSGFTVNRKPKLNDYFRIDLPAPKAQAGKGYDWVQIKKMEEVNDERNQRQQILLEVHPAKNPQDPGRETAHFLEKKASSSFLIERIGTRVTAYVFGRNETPNTKETKRLADKIRNAVVSITAMLGGSNIQWKALVKGLLQV